MNADPIELAKFGDIAHRWWDPQSEFRPLHEINPLRLDWIERHVGNLNELNVLDVGCGGGILSEGLASRGAHVTGIDLGDKALSVAKLHLYESNLSVNYEKIAVETLANQRPGEFDVVTCMEMLEHVPDPGSIIEACSRLVKPGGHVFFSTLNRNPKSYLLAILGAEYILKLLPRGTHDWAKFIKPSELSRACRLTGLTVKDMIGMSYNPFTKAYSLGKDTDVNYIIHTVRDM